MSPYDAKTAIYKQALTYSERALSKQINDSAVEGLLRTDAGTFADLPEIADAVFAYGWNAYRTMMGGRET